MPDYEDFLVIKRVTHKTKAEFFFFSFFCVFQENIYRERDDLTYLNDQSKYIYTHSIIS